MKKLISPLVLVLLFAHSLSGIGQTFSWAKSCNDSGKVTSFKVAVDAAGNTYSVGYYKDTVTIGTTTLMSLPGSLGYCLVKYDSSGNIVWVQSGGGQGRNGGNDVHVDAAGNIYVSGYFHSSITFGSTTLSVTDTDFASDNLFVVKYNSGGVVQWAKQSTGYCQVSRSSVWADATGNVYVSGQFTDSLTLGSSLLIGAVSQSFVAKYDLLGNIQWARQSSGTGYSGSYGVSADNSGNVYITGFLENADSFGTFFLTGHGATDAYLVKYGASGNVAWARRAGGSGALSLNQGSTVCIDDTGNVYISGSVQGVADVGPFTLTGSSMPSFFLAKYDSTGNVKWALAPSGINMVSRGYGMAIDNQNNLFVTGEYSGTMTFAGIPSITCDGGPGGSYDAFITNFNGAGAAQWSLSGGGINDDDGNGIAINGRFLSIDGGYFGAATFGPFVLSDALPSNGVSFVAGLRDTSSVPSDAVSTVTNVIPTAIAYPNPASGLLHIQFQQSGSASYYVLFNIVGQRMQEGLLTTTIDISALPNGQYILKTTEGDGVQTQRVLVVNN